MSNTRVFAIILLYGFTTTVNAKLSCKDESGKDSDWTIFYKLPQDTNSPNSLVKTGEAYSYLRPGKSMDWVLSEYSVENEKSVFAQTYNQIIQRRSKLSYIIYNDQEPNKTSSASTFGHTKGVLATDGVTGFWLVHSIPRYPNKPEDGGYDYPENAKQNGQSGICITFDFETLPKIVTMMRYNKPKIYAKKTQVFMTNLSPEVKNFFTGDKPIYIKKAPFNLTTEIKSLGGKTFTVFGKHSRWGQELYDDAIAPYVKSSLLVETWRNGAGTKLDTDCQDEFTVYNVENLEIDFKGKTSPEKFPFSRTVDHSKWAVSQQGYATWACVADINRMDSQKRRGGGAICAKDQAIWKAYYSIIDKYEGCKI